METSPKEEDQIHWTDSAEASAHFKLPSYATYSGIKIWAKSGHAWYWEFAAHRYMFPWYPSSGPRSGTTQVTWPTKLKQIKALIVWQERGTEDVSRYRLTTFGDDKFKRKVDFRFGRHKSGFQEVFNTTLSWWSCPGAASNVFYWRRGVEFEWRKINVFGLEFRIDVSFRVLQKSGLCHQDIPPLIRKSRVRSHSLLWACPSTFNLPLSWHNERC